MANNRNLTRRLHPVIDKGPSYYWHHGYGCKSFWSVITPLAAEIRNYLFNPSMEGEDQEWITEDFINGGSVERSPFAAFDAGFGLRVFAPPAATQYEANRAAMGSSPIPYPGFVALYGKRLFGSLWIRGHKGDTINTCFEIDGVLGGVIATLAKDCATIEATGQWQRVQFSVLATYVSGFMATGVPVQIRVVNDNGSGAGFFDIDAGYVGFDTPPDTFFDGDSDGASWTGTPHASQSIVSRFSRTVGNRQNFYDLGLDIYADEGWGHPDVENITTSYARLDGAHFQRTKFLPRVIRISFDIQICPGCNGTKEIHRIRQNLIKALNYRYKRTCNTPLVLIYQPVDDCCKPIGCEVRLPVVYNGGLEGNRQALHMEKIVLEFVAYDEVTWRESQSRSVTLPENGTTLDFDVGGDDDTYPILRIAPGANGPMTLNRIVNFTVEAALAFGVPTLGYVIPANSYLIVNTDPTLFSATLYDALGNETSVENIINFAQSDIQNFRLVPDGSNALAFEGTPAPSGNTLINVYWSNRWLSADGSIDCYDSEGV